MAETRDSPNVLLPGSLFHGVSWLGRRPGPWWAEAAFRPACGHGGPWVTNFHPVGVEQQGGSHLRPGVTWWSRDAAHPGSLPFSGLTRDRGKSFSCSGHSVLGTLGYSSLDFIL